MRKGMYKPVLAVLLSVLVSLHAAEPLPVLADTTDETGGTTDGEDTGQGTEEEGRTIETTSSYQDDNGMIYRWYGYDDGTAEIYEFEPATEEIVIDIPEELDGYVVTSLTGSVTYKTIESLTIPETITHFGKSTFYNDVINNLYYNAVDAGNEGDFFYCPFAYSDVYNLYIGDAVEVIEGYTFYQTVFHQGEIALHVPHIGTYAFHSAVFEVLTLTNDIGQIDEMAFTQAKMEYLCYNCPDVALSDVDDVVSSPFYMAVIKDLEFSDSITAVPDYLFANAHFKMKEFTIDRERIGKKAFYQVWNTTDFYAGTDMVETLTITEDVKFIGEEAFAQCWIKELVWNADVETDASSTVTGIFYMADIFGITIGENVEKLPDYCFANADLNFTEFTISAPQIGTACFYDAWVSNNLDDYPVNLTITDEVTYIGARAFERCIISYLDYESNAATGATSTVTGPFYMAELSGLTIGEQVEEIQPFLFANTDFMENMDLTIDVPIGNYAFYTALSYYKGFENLTIGEHVTSMGKGAFYNRDISSLTYNAVYAENANTKTGEAAFWNCEIGSLAIGEQVEVLDAGTFCGIQLSQEELVIPDSVREIGNYVLYNASYIADQIDIDTLKIGSGLQYISYNAFRELNFSSIYVEALEAREDYNPVISSAYTKYLPGCDNLYIHHDSAFYSFFEANAANVNLYCDDYMVPSEGEEYFDEDTHQYVTPSYEICSVCGYQITTNAYKAVCAVTFVAEGNVIDTKYCRENGTVTAPEAPGLEGYEFSGWDTDFSRVTEDMTVTAVYTAIVVPEPVYQISVHAVYADGSESEVTAYEAKAGDVITLPVYEGSLSKHISESYQGERQFAPEFVWSVETADGSYTVNGNAEIIACETNFYQVCFVDEAGNIVDTQLVPSGYDAIPPVIEDAVVDEEYGTVTKSWEETYYNITAQTIVRMQGDTEFNTYVVSFVDEFGREIDRQMITHGEAAMVPEAPQKGADTYYTYHFVTWESANGITTEAITGDVVFMPVYEELLRSYTVTFLSNGGNEIASVNVDAGDLLLMPETPDREGFVFSGWYADEMLTELYDWNAAVLSDMTLYAKWVEAEPEPPEPEPTEPKPEPATPEPEPAEPESEPIIPEPEPLPESEPTAPEPEPTEPATNPEPIPIPEPELIPESVPDSEPRPSNEEIVPREEEIKDITEDGEPPVSEEKDTEDGEEGEQNENTIPVLPVVVSLVVGLGSGGGVFFLFFFRRRKLIGTITDVDGEAVEGIRATLDEKETFSNEKGKYTFKGMRRGNHDLCIYNSDGSIILSISICSNSGADEEVFTILKDSCVNLDTHREGKNYLVDAVIANEIV